MTSNQGLVTSYQAIRRHNPEDNNLATFDFLTTVLKIQVFWDVTLCHLAMLPTRQPKQYGWKLSALLKRR
jgi:hypothetical protein